MIANNVYLNGKKTLQEHRRIHNIVHFMAALLTFGVLFGLLAYDDGNVEAKLVVLPLTYTTIGFVVWNITYALHREKGNDPDPEMLDN